LIRKRQDNRAREKIEEGVRSPRAKSRNIKKTRHTCKELEQTVTPSTSSDGMSSQ